MLADFQCDTCGYVRVDKYFTTWKASERKFHCPVCRHVLRKLAANPIFHSFKPFTHMTKDGRQHRITTERQRQDMMRAYGLEPHPYSDSVEAKADPRELHALIQEQKKAFPEHYRKLRSKVKIATEKEVAPMAARAKATKFETVRP